MVLILGSFFYCGRLLVLVICVVCMFGCWVNSGRWLNEMKLFWLYSISVGVLSGWYRF